MHLRSCFAPGCISVAIVSLSLRHVFLGRPVICVMLCTSCSVLLRYVLAFVDVLKRGGIPDVISCLYVPFYADPRGAFVLFFWCRISGFGVLCFGLGR